MSYDHWKANNPADEFLGPEPEIDTMSEEMSHLEAAGITTDILGTYKRGLRVGREKAVNEVIDWMVERGYPAGELDDLSVLLCELERMVAERAQPNPHGPHCGCHYCT